MISSMSTAPIKYGAHEKCIYKISFRPQHLRFACNQTFSSGIRLSSSHQQPKYYLKITAVQLTNTTCPHTAFRYLLYTFPSSYRHNSYSMFHLTDILTQQIKLHVTKETCYHIGVYWGIMQIFLIDLHAFTLHTTREVFFYIKKQRRSITNWYRIVKISTVIIIKIIVSVIMPYSTK